VYYTPSTVELTSLYKERIMIKPHNFLCP